MQTSRLTPALMKRLHRIKAFLFDVEGVLTDGDFSFSAQASDMQSFLPDDTAAIRQAIASGVRIGILTGAQSLALVNLLQALSITEIYQGSIDKLGPFNEFKSNFGYRDEEIGYMGDSMLDLPVLKRVGFSAAPLNAHPTVRIGVHYVSPRSGGRGAVKDVLDLLISAQANV